jgi:serine/threonine protein kinase
MSEQNGGSRDEPDVDQQRPERGPFNPLLRLMGVDPRDAPGSAAHHHYMALAFVCVNIALAYVLFYLGVVVILPDIDEEVRKGAAAGFAVLIGLADLYVVSERDRHPQVVADRPTAAWKRQGGKMVELFPRLLLSAVTIFGLGLLLSVQLNSDGIQEYKEKTARADLKDEIKDELQTYKDSKREAQKAYDQAQSDQDEANADWLAKKALYGCEAFRTPPPEKTPGCSGDAGKGKNTDDAAEARDKAQTRLNKLTDVANSALNNLTDARTALDDRRVSIRTDPEFQVEAAVNDGWASTLRELRRYQDSDNQNWIERWWPEIVIGAVELTPLLFILFTGLTTSRINRERRLLGERLTADLTADDELHLLHLGSEEIRLSTEDAAEHRRALEQLRHQTEEQAYAEWLEEYRPLPAAGSYDLGPSRDPAPAPVAPGDDEGTPVFADEAGEGLGDTPSRPDRGDTESETGAPGPDEVPVSKPEGLDDRQVVPWLVPVISDSEPALDIWQEGTVLEFQGYRYRLIRPIADPDSDVRISSSLVWLGLLLDPDPANLDQPRWAALKLIPSDDADQPRFEAEQRYVDTIREQGGLVRFAGSRPLTNGMVFAYEYWPRSDAHRYVFGGADSRPPITLGDLLDWLDDGLDGLSCMWHYGLLHNDVKLLNLLVTGEWGQPPTGEDKRTPTRKVLIADFDSVTTMDNVAAVPGISLERCAPEVYSWYLRRTEENAGSPPLTPRSDLYGLFASVYEVASGGSHPRRANPSVMTRTDWAAMPTVSVAPDTTAPSPLDPFPLGHLVPNMPEPFTRLLQAGVHTEPGRRFPGAGYEPRDLARAAHLAVADCRAKLSLTGEKDWIIDASVPPGYSPTPAGWPART